MSIKPPAFHSPGTCRGFSMVEILVTVVVAAIGLVGLAGLQISAVNTTTVASANTQAMIAMKEIMGQLAANPEAAKAGSFNIAPLDPASSTLTAFSEDLKPASASDFAANITYNWFRNLNDAIPGVKAGIHCDGLGMCAIRIKLSDAVDGLEHVISVQL